MQYSAIQSGRAPVLLLIPPPVLFGLCFLAGVFLGHRLPSPRWMQAGAVHSLGWVLLTLAACLALASMGCFLWQRTTLIPVGHPARLVTAGPFALSRNPMYIAVTAAYCGGALILAQFWVLPLVALPLTIVQRIVVPFEEQRLSALFGDDYRHYRERVRRWL
jgi:protein-S-isoprenylcysteine O-methyltransferase Ste14